MSRTDAEIVAQTEELAAFLANEFFDSTLTSGTYREATAIKARQCWDAACHIQEMLTATDPENAVAELDEGGLDAHEPEEDEKSAAEQILDLIEGECNYWHGRNESRRGGYAILLATAKKIVKQEKEAPCPAIKT